jgi:hypothetical protein
MDYRFAGPSLSNAAGTGVWAPGDAFDNVLQSNLYWSSTSYTADDNAAWLALFSSGNVSTTVKNGFFYVWPVRGDWTGGGV